MALDNSLTGGCDGVGAGLFCLACSERDRGNGLKLGQWRFRLNIRKFLFHCSSYQALELVAQVVELPSLEVFQWPLDLALGDTV